MAKVISVGIVLMKDSLISGATGMDDIFHIASHYTKQKTEAMFKVTYLSVGEEVALNNHSIHIKTTPIHVDNAYDIIIFPPLMGQIDVMHKDTKLNAWIIKMFHDGALISSVCASSFVLAQTGLLDFKRATTHWMYESLFENTFPDVNLESDMILVDEGNIITAGGMSASVDLALYLIEKYLSKDTANKCANILLVDRGRDSQRSYKDLTNFMLIEDEEIKKLIVWAKKNLSKNIGTKELAKKMNLQERTFLRLFKKVLSTTPTKYLQNLRIEEAKTQLINTSYSFEHITNIVGFHNESSFRRLFKKETSLTPGEYRSKFQYH